MRGGALMRGTTLAALVFASLAAAMALLQAPSDSDMFWQLASGDWMLDHGQILDRDVWSFTVSGTQYSVGAWLGQVVLALVYRSAGWVGIDVLRALFVGIAAFFTARITLRVQPHVGWAAVPVLGTILVSRMVWGDRPQLFTLALFPVVLDILFAARLDGHLRRLWILPAVFFLWANLHNAFAIGLAAVAIFAVETLLERDRARLRPFAVALVASVIASLLNPSGPGALGRAVSFARSPSDWIVEEHALDVLTGPGLVFAFLLLVALAAALLSGREGIAARLGAPLLWPGLIVPFALLALTIQRTTPYACMTLAPFVAAMAPDVLRRARATAPEIPRTAAAMGVVLLAAMLAVVAAIGAPRDPDLSGYPTGALAALRDARGNLLNEYDWGGYLIRYAPEHPVFVDGRVNSLYPRGIVVDFQDAVSLAPGYRDVLKRWDIALVLLRPERPLSGALREDGWKVLGADAKWVLLSRP
ncbi:MAG: hypothetical protein AUH85_04490 [Chloroflexi bacterium 13_1_40CM_4_68_4]|nr:MAG: hypothetical protein AUH85_04490 [Chloroflexi bacterium 13_1_40CM_4_68_4]